METPSTPQTPGSQPSNHHLRYHLPIAHLSSVFGNDSFALKAEAFARFFGTPVFIVLQTIIVTVWIVINVISLTGRWHFDEYPFILLNLAFSLQAAYAAPLILLAQTRQADRDKAHSEADAQHREELHEASEKRRELVEKQTNLLVEMVGQNNRLTEQVNSLLEQNMAMSRTIHELTERIETLTQDMCDRLSAR